MIERNVEAAFDVAASPFVLAADVDHDRWIDSTSLFRQGLSRDPVCSCEKIEPVSDRRHAAIEVSNHVVKTDPAQTHDSFFFTTGFGDDHDRLICAEHRSTPCGVFSIECDVDHVAKVSPFVVGRVANIDNLRSAVLQFQNGVY